MPQQTSELTAAVRTRARERQGDGLSKMTEDELPRLHADIQAEMRRRYEASKPAAPSAESGAGWSIQAGRMIRNDDKA